MLVILKQNIENLGKMGDVVEVKGGYARNFLLPQDLVEISSPEKVAMIASLKEKQRVLAEKEKEGAQVLADKLSHGSFTITVSAGQDDKLFGAVTAADIAKALQAEGLHVPKKKIELEEPIKKLGIYTVNIKLSPEVETQCKLWIVKE